MKDSNSFHIREAWVLCFFLGVVMINYPFIHIFNKDVTLFGIPLLILYFFLGWPLSILVVYFFSRQLSDEPGPEDGGDQSRKDQG